LWFILFQPLPISYVFSWRKLKEDITREMSHIEFKVCDVPGSYLRRRWALRSALGNCSAAILPGCRLTVPLGQGFQPFSSTSVVVVVLFASEYRRKVSARTSTVHKYVIEPKERRGAREHQVENRSRVFVQGWF
jgi:hypothetical protein